MPGMPIVFMIWKKIVYYWYRLLDLLAGRMERKGIRGYLLVDGNDQPHNFKCMTGYVVQVLYKYKLTIDMYVRALAIELRVDFHLVSRKVLVKNANETRTSSDCI